MTWACPPASAGSRAARYLSANPSVVLRFDAERLGLDRVLRLRGAATVRLGKTSRRVLVRTYFFCIVLNMLLNRTVVGRDIMKKVEELYADARYEEITEEEREWLMRINLIWKNGCGSGVPRDIV